MTNQRRMADNVTRYEAGHAGVPRKGWALRQGIAICGRCGRRMSLRYERPDRDYRVYCSGPIGTSKAARCVRSPPCRRRAGRASSSRRPGAGSDRNRARGGGAA